MSTRAPERTPPGEAAPPVLQARGLSKSYGAVEALRDVDFEVGPGEVVALMGDNGAGKSTLVKILAGAIAPDRGEILLDGEAIDISSPGRARELGVETVYQDLALADDLPAAENLFLGRAPVKAGILGRFGWLDVPRMRREAEDHLARLGVTLKDSRADVKFFSGGQKQSVAIARAAMWARRLIIMDEPTAALGIIQTEAVLQLIRRTRELGTAVVVISHSVPEVMAVADRIVVLRLGQRVATLDPRVASGEDVVAAITGAKSLEVLS
jgi:simple sugar transport system ATP-binding protein